MQADSRKKTRNIERLTLGAQMVLSDTRTVPRPVAQGGRETERKPSGSATEDVEQRGRKARNDWEVGRSCVQPQVDRHRANNDCNLRTWYPGTRVTRRIDMQEFYERIPLLE